jgi:hypothetical protein
MKFVRSIVYSCGKRLVLGISILRSNQYVLLCQVCYNNNQSVIKRGLVCYASVFWCSRRTWCVKSTERRLCWPCLRL